MISLEANVARYRFECGELAQSTFQVVRFTGSEAISQPYQFVLDLVSEDPSVSFADVIDQPATLVMMRGLNEVPVRGIVIDFQQSGKSHDHFVYRAVLRPQLWRLSLSYQSRIFQQMTTEEVVRQVLQDAGLSSSQFRFDLQQSLPQREYRVQYRESDLDFISRWLEYEGIWYYFDHSSEPEVLVFTDSTSGVAPVSGDDLLVYDDFSGLVEEQETISEIAYREQLLTGKVVMLDYNFETPTTPPRGEAEAIPSMPGVFSEYGQHFKTSDDGARLARVRAEEIASAQRLLSGRSNCVAARTGYTFALDQYYREELNQDYLIIGVTHQGSQQRALGTLGASERLDGEEVEYRNTVSAIPASVAYRPARRTPWPRIPGIMNARIETGGGDYAFIDESGRYHVKMPFDLASTGDGRASRPLRMSQPYSGPNYGIHFPNHANTEMIWACVDGNPDRPLALGTVPNPNNTSPSVSENKMQNVIRTFAGNEILLDDTIDEAQVRITTSDSNTMLFDDKDDRILVATTKKHQMTFDDKNERIELKSTKGHFVLIDDRNAKMTIQSEKGHRISISDDDELMTITDEKAENRFVIDIGNGKLTIESKNGDIDILAPNGTVQIKATKLVTESSGDTEMKAANIKTEAQVDHKIKATNISMDAAMDLKQKGLNVTSEAGLKHDVKGVQVKSEGSAMNDVAGAMTNVKATGVLVIQGSLVKIN